MQPKNVLIVGDGHLAYRLNKMLLAKKYAVTHTHYDNIVGLKKNDSLHINVAAYLHFLQKENFCMVYLLEEKDELNLALIIALTSLHKNLPITASLFNENLVAILEAKNDHLTLAS